MAKKKQSTEPSAHAQMAALKAQLAALQETANAETLAFTESVKEAIAAAALEAPTPCSVTLTWPDAGSEFAIAFKGPGNGRTPPQRRSGGRDPRLPEAGTEVDREYKGETYTLLILDDGVELGGVAYRSVSAAAKALTGNPTNGFAFWGLDS